MAALDATFHLDGRRAQSHAAPDNKQDQFPTLAPTLFASNLPLVPTTTATTVPGLAGHNARQHAEAESNREEEFTLVATTITSKSGHVTTTAATGKPGPAGLSVPSRAAVATSSELDSTVVPVKLNPIPNSATLILVLTTALGPTGRPARLVAVSELCLECDTVTAVVSAPVFVSMATSLPRKPSSATWATVATLTGADGLVVVVILAAKMSDFDSVVAVLAIQPKKFPNPATRAASSATPVSS